MRFDSHRLRAGFVAGTNCASRSATFRHLHHLQSGAGCPRLKYINQYTKKFVFLNEKMKGQKIATAKEHGVLEQTKFEHYKKGLEDFQLVNKSDAILRGTRLAQENSFSFWKMIEN